MAKTKISKLVLHWPTKVPAVFILGRRVADGLDGSKYVTKTRIPIPQLRADLDALQAAEANVKHGGVDPRDAALATVKVDLETLLGDVNLTIQQNPAQAALITDSCGFEEPKAVTRAHQPAKAKFTAPGTAQIFLEGVGDNAYLHWQIREVAISPAPANAWLDGGMTTVANQLFANLTPGKTYEVQWRQTKVRTTASFGASFTFMMH